MRITRGSVGLLLDSAWNPGLTAEGLEAHLMRLLQGQASVETVDLLRSTYEDPENDDKMDSVTCALLAHHGINPAIALAIGLEAAPLNFADERGAQTLMITADAARVRLMPDAVPMWHSHNVLTGLPALPETLVASFGNPPLDIPLRDIVSHPALDPMDLKAVVVTAGETTEIIVGGSKWVRGAEMAAILPQGRT